MSAKNSSSKAAKATNIFHTIAGAVYRLIHGDCVQAMMTLMACSVAAVVCDPPYFIELNNLHFDKARDGKTPYDIHLEWAREALRVLVPGGYVLAFAATRTVHHLMRALEDAGFEVVGLVGVGWHHAEGGPHSATRLMASHEPIVIARKPHEGTLKTNRATFGTGILNIDGTKVLPSATVTDPAVDMETVSLTGLDAKVREMTDTVLTHHEGCEMVQRPVPVDANDKVCSEADAVATRTMHLWRCVKGCACRTLNESDPRFQLASERKPVVVGRSSYYLSLNGKTLPDETLSSPALPIQAIIDGHESELLFYSKPNPREKQAGLDHLPTVAVKAGTGIHGTERLKKNTHQTVKPIALMAHLLRLVVPAGGTVLDCFAGSGTTGCAVGVENAKPNGPGWKFIGIEADFDNDGFIAQAAGRITHWSGGACVSVERHQSADTIEQDHADRQAEKAARAARKARTAGGTRTATSRKPTRTSRSPRTTTARRAERRTTTGPAKRRAAVASTEQATKAQVQKPKSAPEQARTTKPETQPTPPPAKPTAAKSAPKQPAAPTRKPTTEAAPAKPAKRRTAPPARPDTNTADDRQRQQDLYFLKLADTVRDVPPGAFDTPGTKPTANPDGAVLVTPDGRVIGTGYDTELDTGGSCLHAELAAILNAARSGARTEGATLYTTNKPCPHCRQAAT